MESPALLEPRFSWKAQMRKQVRTEVLCLCWNFNSNGRESLTKKRSYFSKTLKEVVEEGHADGKRIPGEGGVRPDAGRCKRFCGWDRGREDRRAESELTKVAVPGPVDGGETGSLARLEGCYPSGALLAETPEVIRMFWAEKWPYSDLAFNTARALGWLH